MATISACAVGSSVEVTRLVPSARTTPLRTTTAPNGPPRSARTFSMASSMARCMKWFCIPGTSSYCNRGLSGHARQQPAAPFPKLVRIREQAQDQECLRLEIVEKTWLDQNMILLEQLQAPFLF